MFAGRLRRKRSLFALCSCIAVHFSHTATGIAGPVFAQSKTKKLASTGIFAFSCKLFAVVTVKAADSRCLLLEELCHTDLIDQPAFLLCLVDYIARLAVADQKG